MNNQASKQPRRQTNEQPSKQTKKHTKEDMRVTKSQRAILELWMKQTDFPFRLSFIFQSKCIKILLLLEIQLNFWSLQPNLWLSKLYLDLSFLGALKIAFKHIFIFWGTTACYFCFVSLKFELGFMHLVAPIGYWCFGILYFDAAGFMHPRL